MRAGHRRLRTGTRATVIRSEGQADSTLAGMVEPSGGARRAGVNTPIGGRATLRVATRVTSSEGGPFGRCSRTLRASSAFVLSVLCAENATLGSAAAPSGRSWTCEAGHSPLLRQVEGRDEQSDIISSRRTRAAEEAARRWQLPAAAPRQQFQCVGIIVDDEHAPIQEEPGAEGGGSRGRPDSKAGRGCWRERASNRGSCMWS